MTAYYNEIDPFAAAWLRNLIKAGLIANGDVDDRSVRDVQPDDLRGYSQCHFFAGIGGWSYAFRLAGLPDDFPAWSGSCPCQPFSAAGKRKGVKDDRHLWPAWFRLIGECRPAIVFGEQVSSAIGHGWLDEVADDFESEVYAFGAAVFPVSLVGAPHIRKRVYFVADAGGAELWKQPRWRGGTHWQSPTFFGEHGATQRLADANGCRRPARNGDLSTTRHGHSAPPSGSYELCDAHGSRLAIGEGFGGNDVSELPAAIGTDWWAVEPDVGRVAHGIPGRVGKLHGLGNAIVPKAAAKFIVAALDYAP